MRGCMNTCASPISPTHITSIQTAYTSQAVSTHINKPSHRRIPPPGRAQLARVAAQAAGPSPPGRSAQPPGRCTPASRESSLLPFARALICCITVGLALKWWGALASMGPIDMGVGRTSGQSATWHWVAPMGHPHGHPIWGPFGDA
jgi:hypothetical protein